MNLTKQLTEPYRNKPGLYIISPVQNPDKIYKVGMGVDLDRRIHSYKTCFVHVKVHCVIVMNFSRLGDVSNVRQVESKILKEMDNYRMITADKTKSEWLDITIDFNDNQDEDDCVNKLYNSVMKILDDLPNNSDTKPVKVVRYGKLNKTRSGKRYGSMHTKVYKTGVSRTGRLLKPSATHFTNQYNQTDLYLRRGSTI